MNNLQNISGVDSVVMLMPDIEKLAGTSPELTRVFADHWKQTDFLQFKVTRGNRTITSYFLKPRRQTNLPCIVYNRGGVGDFGRIEDKQIYFILAEMASWGYAVLAVEYGDYDQYGGEDVNDVKYVLDVLKESTYIDTNKVGLYGASRGGMMNYLLLKNDTFAKCAVIKAGVSNQDRGYELRPDLIEVDSKFYDSSSQVERNKRSAVKWADQISKSSPILLIHGTADKQVSVLDSLEMSIKLQENNIPFSMHILNGDDHRTSKNKKFTSERTRDWFDMYL